MAEPNPRHRPAQPGTTLERLRVFHAISRIGTVAGAARSLDYTPSAVSQHLSALERETATALVERSNRGVELTDAGRVLAARASEILDLVATSLAESQAAAGRRAASITVAAFPSAIITILIPLRARLAPNNRLTIVDAEAEEALVALRAHRVDAAITDGHARERHGRSDDLHCVVLRTERIRLVARSDRVGSRLTDHAGDPWILGRADGRLGAGGRDVCAAAGFTPDLIAETDDHHIAFDLIRAEGAVALLPELALADLPTGLAVADIDVPMERRIEFVTRLSMTTSPAVADLTTELTALIQDQPAIGRNRHS